MSVLKKALFLYAMETNNLTLRQRHKESKTKIDSESVDRLEILCINLLADLEIHEAALQVVGITPEKIQEFRDKAALLENYKNSVRQAIIERAVDTNEIQEIEKQINRLLIDRLDRFMSLFKASDPAFFKAYRGSRRIIGNSGGGTGPKPKEGKDAA